MILIPEIKTLVIASNHRPRVIFVDALCVFAASEVFTLAVLDFMSLSRSQRSMFPQFTPLKNVYHFKAFIH